MESFILKVLDCLVREKEFFDAIYKQIGSNSSDSLQNLEDELKNLRINLSRIEKQIENLLSRLSEDESFTNSPAYRKKLDDLENQKIILTSMINDKDISIGQIKNSKIDKSKLRDILSEFASIYDGLDFERKKRLNHLIFSEIKSYYRTGEEDGVIEINLRGDGCLEKKWSEIKNANSKPTVRTSDIFGSASRTRTCNPSVNSRMLHH